MQQLSTEDIEQIVHLVATAGDPTISLPIPLQKRALLEGAARLVGADAWIWSVAVLNPQIARDVMSVQVVDGGWRNEHERAAIFGVLVDPKFNDATIGPVRAVVERDRFTTFLRDELISPGDWSRVGAAYQAAGYEHSMVSVYPLNREALSAIGMHRRRGRSAFDERERLILHIIFRQVDWLHREGTYVSAGKQVVQLSPRQRQVLLFLLGGDSRKSIANKLRLSEHTVGDYLKQIYKQFDVNSRGELLSQFIGGGQAS